VTQSPTPHLNWTKGKEQANHTVFGRVLKGLDVALVLQVGDTIESASVIRKRDHAYVPKKLAEKSATTKKSETRKSGGPVRPLQPPDERETEKLRAEK